MNLDHPLQVVAPTLDGDVLAVLARADQALTGRAIERATGGSHGGVRRALNHLAREGVILQRRAGRAYLYELNREHLAASWIEGLATLRLQLVNRLRSHLTEWEILPSAGILFGSVARGESGPTSDIDLLLIRSAGIDPDHSVWRQQVMDLQDVVSTWTGNDTRVLEYSEDEITGDEPVLVAASEEGIELYGSLRRLRSLISKERSCREPSHVLKRSSTDG